MLLKQFDLSNKPVGWILNFLTNRTQRVRVNGSHSDKVCASTGSPQGCMLSPLLYILHTNMCQSRCDNRTIIKYADDSVIVSLLGDSETGHGPVTSDYVEWCEASHLQLNMAKTKDMLTDFGKKVQTQEITSVKGQTVQCVQFDKYLGTIIDSKLTFEANCESVCKEGHQRLFCLRKVNFLHIDKSIMTLFYHAVIESVLSFALAVWFRNKIKAHSTK